MQSLFQTQWLLRAGGNASPTSLTSSSTSSSAVEPTFYPQAPTEHFGDTSNPVNSTPAPSLVATRRNTHSTTSSTCARDSWGPSQTDTTASACFCATCSFLFGAR